MGRELDKTGPDSAELQAGEAPEEEVVILPPVYVLKVSRDAMELELELQQSGAETLPPVFEDIMAAIAEKGVVQGLNEKRIRDLCESPRFYEAVVVAKGTPAKTGEDGFVKYLVETERDLRPKLRPDGTVDYRDLGLIQNVEKGQVLCEITHPTRGDDGVDVYGTILEGRVGKDAPKVDGANTEYSEDGTKLLASLDGDASVKRGMVSVVSVLKVSGNVDNSTGDINFIGDVIITGDVLSGFNVISGGNITVKGTVEGATIRAAGDIVISEGINGMNRGSITAGGNLKCKYVQSCSIKTGQNIYSDSVMYCMTECQGDLELAGKRGVLIGGRAVVSGILKAGTIGTNSHIATHVVMNSTNPRLAQELNTLKQRMKEIEAEQLKLTQIVNRVEDLVAKGRATKEMEASVEMANNTKAQLFKEKQRLVRRIVEVEQEQIELSRENRSYIECKGRVHAGVTITFGPLNMQVQQSFVYSRVSVIDNDIAISPLG